MSDLRTAAKQALEALETVTQHFGFARLGSSSLADTMKRGDAHVAMNNLRAALAEEALQRLTDANQEIEAALAEPVQEPVQEPVAWMVYTEDGKSVCVTDHPADFIEWRSLPLYAAPPQRKPLTEEVLDQRYYVSTGQMLREQDKRLAFLFARAVEAAHGIREEK